MQGGPRGAVHKLTPVLPEVHPGHRSHAVRSCRTREGEGAGCMLKVAVG